MLISKSIKNEKNKTDYIKRIEIKRLWGRKDISWELRPDVNILSGVNGIGKSTILNRSVNSLTALEGGALSNGSTPGVHFVFSPEDATLIHFDVIVVLTVRSIHSELTRKDRRIRMLRQNWIGNFISCNGVIWIIR